MEKFMQFKKYVGGLVAVSLFILAGCSTTDMQNIVGSGNAMPTSNKHLTPKNANNVKLFYTNSGLPRHYSVVGRVSAENYNIVGIEHTQLTVADELRKQAALIGANGVMNINAGLSQTIGDAVLIK
jgi:hypothetical protein